MNDDEDIDFTIPIGEHEEMVFLKKYLENTLVSDLLFSVTGLFVFVYRSVFTICFNSEINRKQYCGGTTPSINECFAIQSVIYKTKYPDQVDVHFLENWTQKKPEKKLDLMRKFLNSVTPILIIISKKDT